MIASFLHIYVYLYPVDMMKHIFILFVLFISLSISGQDAVASFDSKIKVSQKDINQDLSLYPNPTTDFFAVKQDESIKKVVLYNWLGKKIKSFAHYKGRIYNVENLDQGIYIVRLFDEKDRLSKVLRLHRN